MRTMFAGHLRVGAFVIRKSTRAFHIRNVPSHLPPAENALCAVGIWSAVHVVHGTPYVAQNRAWIMTTEVAVSTSVVQRAHPTAKGDLNWHRKSQRRLLTTDRQGSQLKAILPAIGRGHLCTVHAPWCFVDLPRRLPPRVMFRHLGRETLPTLWAKLPFPAACIAAGDVACRRAIS